MSSAQQKQQEEITWNFLVDRIKNEKYVLMIGPEVFDANSDGFLYNSLANHLKSTGIDGVSFYPEEQFFSFKDDLAYFAIQQYYESQPIPEIYRKIAQIPFHLIISLSPDLLLRRAFEEKDYEVAFDFYKKNGEIRMVDRPSVSNPLIYNLLGSVEDEESLVFTYDDLFDYLMAIFGANHLPNTLRTTLKTTKNYIFLGFKFNKWYLKLLLRLLDLHQNKSIAAYCKQNSVVPYVKDFYEKQFNIQFIEEDVNLFINTLYDKCEEQNSLRGLLQTNTDSKDTLKLVQEYIANDDIPPVFQAIKSNLTIQQRDEFKELIQLEQEFNKAKRDYASNQISRDQYNLEVGRVTGRLLELAQNVC